MIAVACEDIEESDGVLRFRGVPDIRTWDDGEESDCTPWRPITFCPFCGARIHSVDAGPLVPYADRPRILAISESDVEELVIGGLLEPFGQKK